MANRDHIGGNASVNQYTVTEKTTLHGNIALIVVQKHHAAHFTAAGLKKHRICRTGADDLISFCQQTVNGGLNNGGLLVAEQSILPSVLIQRRHRYTAVFPSQKDGHGIQQGVSCVHNPIRRQPLHDLPERAVSHHGG